MSTKKIILAIVALVLLLGGLGAGLFLIRQQQDISEKAAPATSISFKTPTKTILVGESFDVTVEVDTQTNVLAGADLEVNYDPAKISLVSLTESTFLPTKLAGPDINNTAGSASISLGAQVSNPPQGKGIIATLKFKAVTSGNATLTFGPKTRASSGVKGEGSADLITSRPPATLTIIATGESAGTGATPSPTPTPAGSGFTATPTPSPTAVPVGSTGATATPKATATPSASAKPTVTLPANKTVNAGDTITGTAAPNSTVTITIQSDPVTATVKADSTGKWSYVIPTGLSAGTHTITVTDSNGTYTTTFTVSGASGSVANPSGETPEAGTSLPTLIGIVAGIVFIVTGSLFALK